MPNPDVLRWVFTADCALIVDKDGTISWCNTIAADLLGIDAGSIPGWDFPLSAGAFFPNAATPLRLEDFPLGQVLVGETIENAEVCIRSPRTAGADIWLNLTVEPIFSVSLDEVVGALVLGHEITDRKKALQGLEDAHAALRALVHASPLPILALDPEGRISFWSRAAEHLFGWTESEVYGKPLPFVPDQYREESRQILARNQAGEVLVNREVRRRRKDGSLLDLAVSTAPIRDRTDALSGTICVYVDITERKQLEERLRQAAKMESLGTLAAGVAHDFNNLLTTVLGHTSLALEDAIPGSEQAKALNNVLNTVDRAVAITSQMLAYAGRARFNPAPLDLSAAVAEMLPLLKSSVGSRVDLHSDLGDNLPPVLADRGQLRQVVINLVLNAREAIPNEGTVWLRTGKNWSGDPGVHCCFIEVRDNGSGMDRDTQDRMFDPFFSTRFTGRGLGLAAVQGIVHGHKGSIQVTSAPGKGTSFVVSLPAAR